MQDGPRSAVRLEPQFRDSPVGGWARAIAFDRTERFGDAAFEAMARIKCDDASAAWNQIDEALEGSLYGIEVFVDIGVVELN